MPFISKTTTRPTPIDQSETSTFRTASNEVISLPPERITTEINTLIKTATNASRNAFSIWELCENILKFLPCDDIVRTRRVSTTLKNVVDQTAALQQPLFLQPRAEASVWTITTRSSDSGGSFYDDRLLAGLNMAQHVKESILGGEVATELPIFELHPELKLIRLHSVRYISLESRGCAKRKSFYNTTEVGFDTITNPAADIPRHSSLNKMFLSQPPARQVRVALKCCCRNALTLKYPEEHFDPNGSIAIRNDNGVTFGQIRDSVQFARKQCPTARFHYLMFGKGLPVSRREKQSIEAASPLLWQSDPFITAAVATIERLGLVV